jgi:tetratricopeptide (TPR) repeat protein
MMRMATGIRISRDGACAAERAFSKTGLLFLMSRGQALAAGGPALELADEPQPERLIFAVFARRGKGAVAAALRDDLILEGGKTAYVDGAIKATVGREDFRIEGLAGRASKQSKKIALLTLATVVTVVVAAFMLWRATRETQPLPQAKGIGTIADEPESPGTSAELVEEARLHLREGKPEQARMALAEAIERSDDSEAKYILDEMDSSPRRAGRDPLEAEMRAKALFDEGMSLFASGEMAEVVKKFAEASELIGRAGIEAPFAFELKSALAKARDAARAEASPHLARAEGLFTSARGMRSEDAIPRLAEALREANLAVGLDPQGKEARELKAKIAGAVSAAAGGWLAAAEAAERLSGCAKAGPVYRRVAAGLSGIDDKAASRALDRAAACAREEGGAK